VIGRRHDQRVVQLTGCLQRGENFAQVIIEMLDGKVKNINTNPGPLDAYDFALRASANTWKEFSQPMPKPMYHGIWSASFRKDLKIEGNHLVLMKNLRNFTVQFELLRKTGVPV